MNFRVLVVSALLVPSIGLAEFTYTGVQVSYVDVEFNSGFVNLDGDGYRFEGSYELNDRFFLRGEWEERSFDLGIDGDALELGGGYRHAFGPNLDLVGTASYVEAEVGVPGFSVDDDGFALGGGVRARLADSFEVDAMLNWVDMDKGGSDTGIELRGRYYFSDRFAIGLETDLGDDFDTLSLGFRAEF